MRDSGDNVAMLQLDHIMYAVPELGAGCNDIASRLGVQPAYGGPHAGRGTHNALLSLGGSQYLEIIAPDPAQSGGLPGFDASHIKTWAVATDDFAGVQAVCSARDFECWRQVMSRNTPAGPTLHWELLFVSGHDFGDLFPFFIDWLESPHPAATTLRGGTLDAFIVETGDPARYRSLMAAFEIGGIRVEQGPEALRAEITGTGGARVIL